MTLKARPAHVSESNEPEVSNHSGERLPRPGYTFLRLCQAIANEMKAIRLLPGSATWFGSSNAKTAFNGFCNVDPATSGRGWPIVEPELRSFGKPPDC